MFQRRFPLLKKISYQNIAWALEPHSAPRHPLTKYIHIKMTKTTYQDWSTAWRDPCWGWFCPRSCRTISRFQRNRGCHRCPWSPWQSWRWGTSHRWWSSSCSFLGDHRTCCRWCCWWGSSCRRGWGHQCRRHRLCRHPWSRRPRRRTWFLQKYKKPNWLGIISFL